MKSHASMNRVYRLVWSAALNLWVAVAENAKGRGKAGSARNKAALLMLVPLAGLVHQAQAADAANAAVVSGAGTVATSGLTTTVNQTTQKLAIDWTSLSTRTNEALVFNQPNAQAIALSRITGSSPSELLGSLTANGQVFILNPNGVLFGAGSQVNVGGLVASTLSMSNADFEAGNYKFTGSGGGSVVNQGTLNAGQGGYLALLAPEVRNEGVMTASLGTALLAAGNKVTLNLDNGSLLGYSIDQGAINALAENKHLIQANGGQVLLSAKAMNSLTTATVNNTGVIEAKTIQNKAGRIMLMGDMETGTVNVAGTLDASAPNGGDGGFIETSAAHVKVAAGTRVTTQAAGGQTGQWLVDPQDYTVAASGGDITGADLSANLGTTNVTLQSSGGGTAGNGDININDAVNWSANTLTLTAARDINVRAVASATGSAGLVMNTGTANGADAAVAGGLVKMALGAGGFTGRVDMATGTSLQINGENYVIVNSLGAEADTAVAGTLQGVRSGSSTAYALGSDIDASATNGWDAGKGFTPLPFSGRFNGLGHSIGNLTVNRPSADQQGLFGALGTGARVGNVGLAGGAFTGRNRVGALVGGSFFATGAIVYNSYATATVNGSKDVGGLVGNSGNFTIQDSYATGAVTGNATANGNLGGLVGNSDGGRISNSYATGNISSPSTGNFGGLAGFVSNTTISGSYATGAVSGTALGAYVATGGLVGWVGGTTIISGSYATGNITNTGLEALSGSGGLVGYFNSTSGEIANSYATGNVGNAGSFAGGLVGTSASTGTIRNSYATGAVTGTGSATLTGGLVGNMSDTTITGSYATGAVLGPAAGGLVAFMSGGSISTSYATGTVGIGGIAAFSAGGLVASANSVSITDSYATGNVRGTTYAGGLVGSLTANSSNTVVSGSYASGAVTAVGSTGLAGGLVGSSSNSSGNSQTITNSYATGNVDSGAGANSRAGGLIGGSGATAVSNSYATGAVSGGGRRGGIVGVTGGGSYTNNFWNSDTATVSFGIAVGTGGNNTGATPLTTAQFKTGAIFTGAGWSLASVGGSTAIWRIYEGHTAPLLRSLLTAVTLADAPDTTVGYNGSAQTGGTTASTPAGLLGSAASGRNAGLYSGYYSAQLNGLDITGGNLTITRANLTVSSSDVNRVYDAGTTATGSAVVTGGTLLGSDALTGGSFAFADKNVGTGKTVNVSGVTVDDGNGGGNYNVTQVDNTNSTITQASLNVTGVTAQNKVYDTGMTVTLGGTATVAALGGDVVNLVDMSVGTFANKNVGTGKAVTVMGYSLSGADAANYAIVQPAGLTADVTQASLAVTGVTAQNKVYNGDAAATLGGTAAITALGSDVVNLTGTGAGVFADRNAGNGKAVTVTGYALTGADALNYAIVQPASVTADITKASLTVSISDVNRVYTGGTTAAGTAVVTGGTVYGSDVLSGGSFAFADKNVGTGKTVNVSGITVADGNGGGNYNITQVNNTSSTITQASLTVTASGINRVYDGTTGAMVAYGDNRLGSDVLGITGSASFADKNAGAGKAVNVSGISVSGADAGNYNLLNTTASTTASITPKALTVTAADDAKNYDGVAYSGGKGVSYSGFVAGDSSADIGGTLAYGGSSQGAVAAGSYLITPGGLNSISGNYALGFTSGALSIASQDANSTALGGTVLVGAYGGAMQAVAGVGGSSGGGSADAMAGALAAAAEAGNTDEK